MATIYSALGAQIDIVEKLPNLMPGTDLDLVDIWLKRNRHRFGRIMMNTEVASVAAQNDGVWVKFHGQQIPGEAQRYDTILQSVGRRPNGKKIAADRAGVRVDQRGFIAVDRQMRTNIPHIFSVGDVVGGPMLAHKAVHEGHVAAEATAGRKAYFDARVIPSVAYTDPEIAQAGITEHDAGQHGRDVRVARFPWAASGRANVIGADDGVTKLIFDAESHRLVGGAVVGPGAGDLIAEICLAIEMGADTLDIERTIHPHPTLSETIGMAAAIAEGICTDLLPQSGESGKRNRAASGSIQ